MSNLWITPEELSEFVGTEFAYEAAKAASYILWSMSGRKYSGTTTVTERYVCATLAYRYGPSYRNTRAELVLGDIYNLPYSDTDSYTAVTTDGLSPQSRLRLRGRPVQKIHTIRNRVGAIVEPDMYYLVDHSTIQATAGTNWTPCDIEVTYTYGTEPPAMGKMAARTLAMEFAKLWNGDDDCALPQRVTSISRQGVSYTLLDSQDFIEELRTGIYAVDLFLKAVNPDKAKNKARVFTPDVPRARRYTPKAQRLTVSELDISVPAGESGSMDVFASSIGADFLVDEVGWTPYVIIRNYAETASATIEGSVTVEDPTPSAINVSNKMLDDNVATLTTAAAHNLEIGALVVVSGVDATFNGTYTVKNVPTTTTFTYDRTASDVALTSASGTVTASTDDRLTVTLTYNDVYPTLGKVDPGTYDIYASRTTGATTETVYIASGNLRIALATSAITAYTVG